MNGIVHPFSGALYERHSAETIRVTLDEMWGIFTPEGRHLEGPLRECDPQLCGWIGGPQIANYRLQDSTAPSEPVEPSKQ